MNELCPMPGCSIERITPDGPGFLHIAAHGTRPGGRCPDCGRASRAVHSRYRRRPADLHIVSGKVAADHVHLFISYRAHQNISQIVQWLKGTSSRLLLQEFPHLERQFWGRHFWARGYFAVTSGTITDDMINEYINEQEGEPVEDDGRFRIDPS